MQYTLANWINSLTLEDYFWLRSRIQHRAIRLGAEELYWKIALKLHRLLRP